MSIEGNNLPVFATNIKNSFVTLQLAEVDLGSLGSDSYGVVIYTAGTNGSRVYNVFLSSESTFECNIYLYILTSGSSVCPIGQIAIPANASNVANTPCVDALAAANCAGLPFDGTQKPYIELAPGASLKMSQTYGVFGPYIFASAVGADY